MYDACDDFGCRLQYVDSDEAFMGAVEEWPTETGHRLHCEERRSRQDVKNRKENPRSKLNGCD